MAMLDAGAYGYCMASNYNNRLRPAEVLIRENGEVEVQAVGAGASNQAVKAIAISRSYMALSGVDLVCIPAFTTVSIDGEERTAMKFIVECR